MTNAFPLEPVHDQLSREFYTGAAEGRLLAQRCASCGSLQFYPRARCKSCHSEELAWEDLSGNGTVYSFSVVHLTPNEEFAGETPYVFAVIELDEGVRMASRVIDVEPDEVRCDMPVAVKFETRGELTLPRFAPR